MKIIFARRRSLASLLIRLFTWSNWSHCGVVIDDMVFESTAKHGVATRALADFVADHSRTDTAIVDCDPVAARAWLEQQIGKGYDWTAVIGIAFRTAMEDRDRWFCSELVEGAVRAGGVVRIRGEISRVTPRDVWLISPAGDEKLHAEYARRALTTRHVEPGPAV